MSGIIQRYYYPETSEQVQTIRQPQSALLLLDSLDRYTVSRENTNSYNSKIKINPNNILINHQKILGMGQIKRIGVSEISFPWVTPNVNIRNNNFYVSDVSGNYYYTTVPEGFYTPAELATAIQNGLNSGTTQKLYPAGTPSTFGGTTWAISSDVKTNAFSVVNTAVSFRIGGPTGTFDLTTMMNITDYTTLVPVGSATGIKGGIPNMAYTKYIDICSSKLTKFQNLKDSLTQFNYTDIIYRLYLDNELGMQTTSTNLFPCRPCLNLYRQIKNPKFMMWNKDEMLNEIDIQLYDDSGELLYIPSNNYEPPYYITLIMSES
jgi:hypothetical protein